MHPRTTKKRPLSVRFFEKVDQSGGENACWIWKGQSSNGYGGIRSGGPRGSLLRATHVAWLLAYGPVPAGLRVCHRCDTPSCVNHTHLFVGTAKDNTRDMIDKKRHCHGKLHPLHRLTEAQVVEIRRLKAAGTTYDVLEDMFGITRGPLHRIVHRTSWTHVP